MTSTSAISGTFVNRQRSPVSVAAASSFSAAFLVPLTAPRRAAAGRPRRGTPRAGRAAPGTPSGTGVRRPCVRPRCRGPSRRRRSATRMRSSARCREARARARSAGSSKPSASARSASLAGLLGGLEVDLRRQVGGLGHDHDLVGPDLEEAAGDGEGLLLAALADAQLAHAERRQQRGMVRQDAELALDARADDGSPRRPRRRAARRDDLEMQRHYATSHRPRHDACHGTATATHPLDQRGHGAECGGWQRSASARGRRCRRLRRPRTAEWSHRASGRGAWGDRRSRAGRGRRRLVDGRERPTTRDRTRAGSPRSLTTRACAAFSRTSSSVPARKNACSGRSSRLALEDLLERGHRVLDGARTARRGP